MSQDTVRQVQASRQFDSLLENGIYFLNNKRYEPAILSFENALRICPSNPVGLNNLGIALCDTGDFENGSACFRQALETQPDFQLALNNLKWAQDELSKSGKGKTASEYFRQGMDLYNSVKFEQSINAYLACISLDPQNALAYNNLGTSYMMLKKPEKAKVNFEKAVALRPGEQLFANNLNWAKSELQKK